MQREITAFGVVSEITVVGEKEVEARAAIERAFALLQHIDQLTDPNNEKSEVSLINQYAYQSPQKISFETRYLIQSAFDFYTRTNQAVDITQGVNAGMDKVVLDTQQNKVRLKTKKVQLDLSAILKGYACDRVIQLLKENKMKRARVRMGDALVCSAGKGPQGRAWRIELKDPQNEKKIAKVLEIKDGAVATSRQGKQTVSVTAPTAIMADMLSNVALALGENEFSEVSKRFSETSFYFYPIEE